MPSKTYMLGLLVLALLVGSVIGGSAIFYHRLASGRPVNGQGIISHLSNDPEQVNVRGDDGLDHTLVVDERTEVIRDIGGTVGGTFTFVSLRVGDHVHFEGANTRSGLVTATLIEQNNSRGLD